MDEEVKLLIMFHLEALKNDLVSNNVSMAVDKESGELFFFDGEKYQETEKATGFKVDSAFWSA